MGLWAFGLLGLELAKRKRNEIGKRKETKKRKEKEEKEEEERRAWAGHAGFAEPHKGLWPLL